MPAARSKTFDGKRYRLRKLYQTPTSAKRDADILRAKGYLVRVVQVHYWVHPGKNTVAQYALYTRRA